MQKQAINRIKEEKFRKTFSNSPRLDLKIEELKTM